MMRSIPKSLGSTKLIIEKTKKKKQASKHAIYFTLNYFFPRKIGKYLIFMQL
jgi:hypothetical protein